MAQVLVRQLDTNVVARLKKRAKEHGRSLQSEVKTILEEAVPDLHRREGSKADMQRDKTNPDATQTNLIEQ